MTSLTLRAFVCGICALPIAAPAMAQDETPRGIYAVVRGGASIDPEQRFERSSLPDASAFRRKTKFKSGLAGEVGGGYDFGICRLEQVVGYTSSDLDVGQSRAGGFSAAGRIRSFSVSVAGYVDVPTGTIFVPYVGGGVGAARVEADLARAPADRVGSSFSGKDWGMLWHADAGVGIDVIPGTTLEIGGRYTQTSSLTFDGQNAGVATTYAPRIRNLSGTVGIRHVF